MARLSKRCGTPWVSKEMRVVETGGTVCARTDEWGQRRKFVCLSPGVVLAYDRNTYTIRFYAEPD